MFLVVWELVIKFLLLLNKFVANRIVATNRILPIGGCDWYDVDVTGYIRQGEYLDSSHSGPFLVDGRVTRVTIVRFSGTQRKPMERWRKSSVQRLQLKMDMHFLRDCNERDYLKMLKIFYPRSYRGVQASS